MFRKIFHSPFLFLLILVLFVSLACESPSLFPANYQPTTYKTFTYTGTGIHTYPFDVYHMTCDTEDEMLLTIFEGQVALKSTGKCMYIQANQDYTSFTCYELHPGDRCSITLTGRYDMNADKITFTSCTEWTTATGTAQEQDGQMIGEVQCADGQSFKFTLPEVK